MTGQPQVAYPFFAVPGETSAGGSLCREVAGVQSILKLQDDWEKNCVRRKTIARGTVSSVYSIHNHCLGMSRRKPKERGMRGHWGVA
jgi:hypothetical protein